ncbi:MAG TPA: hypothetical protein VD790_08380 [Thermoleophilaceae bacterium]|nr:hypothetical protein [Thermoleophilaceae bacterium]
MTAIYRAPMRARDREVEPGAGAEHCLARGLVGIGPGTGEKAARMLHRFATLPEGLFVWTRERGGGYRLGRISGPLREDRTAARAVGITHVRPADWVDRVFAEPEVPDAVARTFARGGRNLQRTHDDEAERLTAELWEAATYGSRPQTSKP